MLKNILCIFCLLIVQIKVSGQNTSLSLRAKIKGELLSENGFEVVLFSKEGEQEFKNFVVKYFTISITIEELNITTIENFPNYGFKMSNTEYFKYVSDLKKGTYTVVIKDIICGPLDKENDGSNSFRPLDLSSEVKL